MRLLVGCRGSGFADRVLAENLIRTGRRHVRIRAGRLRADRVVGPGAGLSRLRQGSGWAMGAGVGRWGGLGEADGRCRSIRIGEGNAEEIAGSRSRSYRVVRVRRSLS